MGDRMTPIPFGNLLQWILTEQRESGKVFGLRRPYVKQTDKVLPIFNEKIETPFGPAAGPHTQLAQNIVAAYYAGSRFFELKTVQILDGEDLPVNKPCILADDECYNVEWSTELRVPDAFNEYVKAWFLLKLMAKEMQLGDENGFVFNMSVGYDLEGIKSEKIDTFIEGLKNAQDTPIWKECKEYALSHLELFERVDADYINGISPVVCTSATLSTLHGCPPAEIERIATYLLTEKKVNTFIKCNPTLLGYEFARKTMDEMGYGYVSFGDFHFKDDLQYEDAVPMIHRLLALADSKGLTFGVKLTNTFPVDIKRKELPGEEMYMSGRSLFALSISLAAKLSREFEGKLRISYSGGADIFNIDKIFGAGIWPITLATYMLKPGGYQRMVQLADKLETMEYQLFAGVDYQAVERLSEAAKRDAHHTKSVKPLPNRKIEKKVPLTDCFMAPCQEGCPIRQDIPAYVKLVGEGKYLEALKVIVHKNPLPFITGTICSHRCMGHCTRNFYEESVQIRSTKLEAAKNGYLALLKELKPEKAPNGKRVAVAGGGPAGMAAAFFLAREGAEVTLFEREASLGGIVRHVIPEFRIPAVSVERDIELLRKMGVKIRLNTPAPDVETLKAEGYDAVVLAVGASKPGTLALEGGEAVNAISFLAQFNKTGGKLDIGRHVVVIGGGNTAMDTARAAKRVEGVESVSLVYRRDKANMPADEEELNMAVEDGVTFRELLAPVSLKDGRLICKVCVLGDPDASGRRSPVETEKTVELSADTVIAAVGEKVNGAFYEANGLKVDQRGRAVVNPTTLESSVAKVYVAGDGLYGPATVVEAIRDASLAAAAILGGKLPEDIPADIEADREEAESKKGVVHHSQAARPEKERCLECNAVCECCVDVCPNRANVAVSVPGYAMPQIVHIDMMCNECGNCKSFCPYDSAPYKDKFTVFQTEADFQNSENQGFVVLDGQNVVRVRLGAQVMEFGLDSLSGKECGLDQSLRDLILTIINNYPYLLVK